MQLRIIGTGSTGNGYVFECSKESLLVECGMPFQKLQVALNFNLSKIVGAIVTHDHNDHAGYIKDYLKNGIDVWATSGTHRAKGTGGSVRSKFTYARDQFRIGGFTIRAFDIHHDAEEPVGYLIQHAECGTVLFLTDTHYSRYTFPGLTNVIIEANYCEEIVRDRFRKNHIQSFLHDRIIVSHMSLQTCIKTLQANDLGQVNNIVLIHLSDSNSNAIDFKNKVAGATGKHVTVAENGMVIPLNTTL